MKSSYINKMVDVNHRERMRIMSGVNVEDFVEMCWVSTGEDKEVMNTMTELLNEMNDVCDTKVIIRGIQLLHGIVGLDCREEFLHMLDDSEYREQYLSEISLSVSGLAE